MSNLLFFAGVILTVVALMGALAVGVMHWREGWGKVVAIGAGVLLLALVAFMSLVALIVASGQAGHPL